MPTIHPEVLTAIRAKLAGEVNAIRSADRTTLDAMHAEQVGYDSLSDTQEADPEDIRAVLLDYVREECFATGIHCADVGLA